MVVEVAVQDHKALVVMEVMEIMQAQVPQAHQSQLILEPVVEVEDPELQPMELAVMAAQDICISFTKN
jgi:hypothetical protein